MESITIKVCLSIGYSSACHEDELEVDREEWESMTEDQKYAYVMEWANNYIDVSYKEEV